MLLDQNGFKEWQLNYADANPCVAFSYAEMQKQPRFQLIETDTTWPNVQNPINVDSSFSSSTYEECCAGSKYKGDK